MIKLTLSPKSWIFISLSLLFVCYCLYQARFLILGPQVSVQTPKDGVVVDSALIDVNGKAKNAAWLSLNGRQIFTDEEGLWSERLIVSTGLSIISVAARDRFGREVEKQIRIIRQ